MVLDNGDTHGFKHKHHLVKYCKQGDKLHKEKHQRFASIPGPTGKAYARYNQVGHSIYCCLGLMAKGNLPADQAGRGLET